MAVSKKAATRNIQTIKLQGHINSFKYQDNDLGTIAITIPRSEIYATFTETELFHNCLYFLFGTDGIKELAYVGQAKKRNSNESVLNRIREHDSSRFEVTINIIKDTHIYNVYTFVSLAYRKNKLSIKNMCQH